MLADQGNETAQLHLGELRSKAQAMQTLNIIDEADKNK